MEPAPNPALEAVRRPVVLIADDEGAILASAQRAVPQFGYGVAMDGEQALELAQKYQPISIITDAIMPRLEGAELCRRIKADPALASTRVILMTSGSLENSESELSLRGCGADLFLQKPLSLKTLQSILKK